MANIKISELNELETKHNNDLLAIVDNANNETKKIKVENLLNENVELIAVSSTAPSECSLGDKYFNTTTNKIYTATGTDTWGTTGEDAKEGILYIVFDTQESYAYNGTTLVSVGGGSGGETLPVGTEVDFDGQASDIPAGWEQVSDKSIMTLTVPDINPISLTEWNNYNITTGYTLANSVGTKLALNNGVKIGAGVSKVKVSAITKIYNNDNNNNTYQININKNGVAQQFTYDTIRAYDWLSEDLPMVLLDVQENDVITVGVTCNKTFSTARVFGGYLTVEEV